MDLSSCSNKKEAFEATSTMSRKELEKICKSKKLPIGNTFVMRNAIAAIVDRYGKF